MWGPVFVASFFAPIVNEKGNPPLYFLQGFILF